MEYDARQMSQKEFSELTRMLKKKDRYLKENRIKILPAIYDRGDKVGIFFEKPVPWHTTGILLESEGFTTNVKTEKGEVIKGLSPFQIFTLPETLAKMT